MGSNLHGELGLGHSAKVHPRELAPLMAFQENEVKIRSVAAGRWHSIATSFDGAGYTWGRGQALVCNMEVHVSNHDLDVYPYVR